MKIGQNIVITEEKLDCSNGYDFTHLSYYKNNPNFILISCIPTNITSTIVISVANDVSTNSYAIYFKNNSSTSINAYCLWINKA